MSIFNNKFKSTSVYGAFNVYDYNGILGVGAVTASFDMSGTGIFRGNVSFANELPTCNKTPTTGNQLITKAFADATYTGIDVRVLNNTWTGTNAFNTYLPTSTVTPTTGTQLITKTYADATYTGSGILSSNNAWTGTNSFNSSLPTSTQTPTTSTQLITKTYADTALNLKANLASPTFTGTVAGIDKTMVGLSNVDNTSDANKPVSSATQTALNLKANLASPTFTGVPLAPTASVGTNTTQIATTAFVLASSTTNEPLLLREAQSLNLDYDTYNVWTTTAGASASTTSSVNYTTAMSANGKISYFAGSGDGVYRSINYFESTTAVNSTPTTYRGVCCSSDGKYVFTPTANITPGSAAAWFYSSNYGTNWTAVTCTTASSQTGQVGFDKPVMSGDGKYILMTVSSPGNLNNIFLSSNYGVTFAVLPFTQTQQASVYPIVMSLTGQYMTIFQFHTANAVCYYSTNYGVSWTAGASVPKMTTACMSAYGETITALGTSSNNYFISTNYGASFTNLTNSGLNSAGQQMACNDSGQFQLVVQSSTNTAWASYDYGTTFASQVITLNNTSGTAFAIAGTWWNLSMSADGRYSITAGGNSGTPIALKLQVKDSIAKNVLSNGMNIYQKDSAAPTLQYLGADGTNYAYLYASAVDNSFIFRNFRSGGFAFTDITGANICTIDNSGSILCSNLTVNNSISCSSLTVNSAFTGLTYICVQDQTTSANTSFNTTERAVVYGTVVCFGGSFSAGSLTGSNTTITIPVSGNYEITASSSLSYSSIANGQNVLYKLYKKTGSTDTVLSFFVQAVVPSAANWQSNVINIIQPLVAGDTVRLGITTSAGTATSTIAKQQTMTIKRM